MRNNRKTIEHFSATERAALSDAYIAQLPVRIQCESINAARTLRMTLYTLMGAARIGGTQAEMRNSFRLSMQIVDADGIAPPQRASSEQLRAYRAPFYVVINDREAIGGVSSGATSALAQSVIMTIGADGIEAHKRDALVADGDEVPELRLNNTQPPLEDWLKKFRDDIEPQPE